MAGGVNPAFSLFSDMGLLLPSPKLGPHALDWLALLVTAMFTAFGPFVSVYLVGQGWDQAHLGVTLSVGTAASVVFQIPTGALVDALPTKREIAALGILGTGASALLLAGWPSHWPVLIAQILFAASAGVMGPVIAAISLTLVGPQQLGYRFRAQCALCRHRKRACRCGTRSSGVGNIRASDFRRRRGIGCTRADNTVADQFACTAYARAGRRTRIGETEASGTLDPSLSPVG